MIRARTEPTKKKKAEMILKQLGIKPTDAINMFYSQIIIKKAIPFSVDLETEDTPENYTTVNSDSELSTMLNLN